MFKDLMELNDFVVGFCNHVVRYACENTTSGNYIIDIDKALEAVGANKEDFLEYKDMIFNELASRDELLDVEFDEKDFSVDVICALAYCGNYEWCEGDEAVFGCSYEEWLKKPAEPIVDRPTYSQLIDTNYAQSVAPSMYFYVGDGQDIDKDYAELGEALEAFKVFADRHDNVCLGVMQRGGAKVLLDNIFGCINLYRDNLNEIDSDVADQLRSYFNEIYPANDFCVGKWRVHTLTPGGSYGAGNCLTYKDEESCVEFWDMSQDSSRFPNGQFTGGRYYISTLFDDKWGAGPVQLNRWGLRLVGDVPAWHVSGEEMKKVFEWLKCRPLADGEHYLYCSGEVDVPFDYAGNEKTANDMLYRLLSKLALTRDINVEHTGVYDKGNGFTFSFVSQAEKDVVEKAIASVFVGFSYELDCESKKCASEREPLDNVIDKCAAQVNRVRDEKTMDKENGR